MTLQQLKYVIEIVNSGSMSEAAKRLYISQPSLSSAVKE
ncbi:MAG TPA: LysR family transcriptional regulator, partial [Clostridiales bacterium]|nr:LysR family transcriptional regulator [Clostridiales bacterium]